METMTVYIGADHRGFALKDFLKGALGKAGYDVVDMGNSVLNLHDDYPDFARAVAEKVRERPNDNRGIVICGSGIGADVTANKSKGIRSALAFSIEQITAGRKDDNVNVLALAADFVEEHQAEAMAVAFLTTPFGEEERYQRRVDKIQEFEDRI